MRKILEVHLFTATLLAWTITSSLLPMNTMASESCSYPNDQRLADKKRNCDNDAARTWNCEVNRCLTTAESQGIRERFKDCAEITEDTARKKCHDDYAKTETKNQKSASGNIYTEDEKGASKGLAMTAAGLNALNAAMLYFSSKGKSPDGGQCISRKIYMGASVISVLAEAYLMMMVDKKLKKLKDDYKDEQVQEEAYSAQIRALEYLKEEQETVAQMAKSRKNAYTLQLVAYGATTVAAGLEVTLGMSPPSFSPTPCLNKSGEEKQLEKEEADINSSQETLNKEHGGVPTKEHQAKQTALDERKSALAENKEAHAEKWGEGGAGTEQAAGFVGGWVDILGTSQAILITAGVSTVIAMKLRSAAAKQEKESKKNAGLVQEMIDKFSSTMAGSGYCSPTQRENVDNAQCYCYEANGDKNMNRTNSQTCVALWAQNERNLMVGATDYKGDPITRTKTCMLLNGQVDRQCKCRQLINKTTGENACMKVPMGTNTLGALGPSLGIPGLQSTVANLASGQSSFGNLNGPALNRQAAKNRVLADKTIAKINNDRAKDGLPPINPFSEKTAQGMLKKLSKAGVLKGAPASAGSLAASARPTTGALAEAIRAADKKSGMTKSSFYSGGSGGRSKGSSGGGDQFAFLNGGGTGGGKVAGGFAEKKYNYKDNDIVKNKSVSIWKVISTRYATSGVRRLFED